MPWQRKLLKTGADVGEPGPLPDDLAGLTAEQLLRAGDHVAAYRGQAFVEVEGGHMDAIERDPQPFAEAIRAFFRRNHVIMPPAPGVPLAGESGGAILAPQSESSIP